MVDGAGLGLGPLLAPLALEGAAAPRRAPPRAPPATAERARGADCGDDREEAREGCVLVPVRWAEQGLTLRALWVRVGASRDAGAVKRQLEADTGVAARDQVLSAPNKAAPFTDRTPVSLLTSVAAEITMSERAPAGPPAKRPPARAASSQ
jgi:hypothetical protein